MLENKDPKEYAYYIGRKEGHDVELSIDADLLEIYINGWYVGNIPIDDLSNEVKEEIQLEKLEKGWRNKK